MKIEKWSGFTGRWGFAIKNKNNKRVFGFLLFNSYAKYHRPDGPKLFQFCWRKKWFELGLCYIEFSFGCDAEADNCS